MALTADHPLKQERQRRNLSQRMLADFAGLGLSTIVRAERGERISAEARQQICDYLNKSSQELGLIGYTNSRAAQNAGENDVNRREALKRLAMTGATALIGSNAFFASDSWEQLSLALRKTPVVSEATVSALETITHNYWQLRATLPPRDVVGSVLGHLQTVTQMLRQSLPEPTHQRLCALAGETAQLLGQMAFDMNDHPSAQSYYRVSIEAAQEAGHSNLSAITLGRASLLPVNSMVTGDKTAMLRKAQLLAKKGGMWLSYAWLSAIEAETWANARDAKACKKALDQAEQALAQSVTVESASNDPYWTEFTPARLSAYKGACFIQLGQSRNAIQALTEGLAIATSHSMRPRAIMLTDLARAHVQNDEIEMGCQVATDALRLAYESKSPMVFGRIQEVRRHLQPWESAGVIKALDEQMLSHFADQLLTA